MKNEKVIIVIMFLIIVVLTGICAGCRTVGGTGDESMVEARIQSAVNAERARLIKELSIDIESGLIEVDKRVTNAGAGLQSVRVAAEEYRRFVYTIIERLRQSEAEVQSDTVSNGVVDIGASHSDSD